jgi:hypothetical protein
VKVVVVRYLGGGSLWNWQKGGREVRGELLVNRELTLRGEGLGCFVIE